MDLTKNIDLIIQFVKLGKRPESLLFAFAIFLLVVVASYGEEYPSFSRETYAALGLSVLSTVAGIVLARRHTFEDSWRILVVAFLASAVLLILYGAAWPFYVYPIVLLLELVWRSRKTENRKVGPDEADGHREKEDEP